MIALITSPFFFSTAGGDYETPVGSEKESQTFKYNYTELNQDHESIIDYTNIPRENVSEYKFNYDYKDIIETLSNESKTDFNIDNNYEVSFDDKKKKYPTSINLTIQNDRGNSYEDEKVDLKNGTYQNTTYKNEALYVKEEFTKGWYRTPWIEYLHPRKVDGTDIVGDYDKIEYRLEDEEEFSLFSDPDNDETVQSVPSGTVADSFQFKIYLNNNRSFTNESYVYQIRDKTRIEKLDKYTGSVQADNLGTLDTFRDFKVAKNHLYTADDYKVASIFKSNMSEQWTTSISDAGGTDSMAYSDNYLYCTNRYDDLMYQLWRTNGTIKQTISGNFKKSRRLAEANENGVFTGNNKSGYIHHWNKENLSLKESYYIGRIDDFDLYEHYIYAVSNRTIMKINTDTWSQVWTLDSTNYDDDQLPVEINYNPKNTNQITFSDTGGTIYQFDDARTSMRVNERPSGAKNYYAENDYVYYGVNDDGKYKWDIYSNSETWYQSETGGDFEWTDSYLEEGGTNQSVSSFHLTYQDGQFLYFYTFDKNGDTNHFHDRWLDEYSTYETTFDPDNTINDENTELNIVGDYWRMAKHDISLDLYYGDTQIPSSTVEYSFNNQTNISISSKTLDVSSDEDSSWTFGNSKYRDMDSIYTEHLGTNKTIESVNSTITITWTVYETTSTSDYMQVMTDLSFYSLLFLIMGVGIVGWKSKSAGIPILVFVIGLYPLSIANIISWHITVISTFLFLGFYIMYSMKRENKV